MARGSTYHCKPDCTIAFSGGQVYVIGRLGIEKRNPVSWDFYGGEGWSIFRHDVLQSTTDEW
jgi:hypothetical protein